VNLPNTCSVQSLICKQMKKTMLLEDASGKLLELSSKLQERIHISTLGDAPICSQIYSGAVGESDVW
jgi:hypothetical protein